MKLTKKLLAMALAGVMLLTILTGCGGGKTGDRLVEEYMATILSEHAVSSNIPITHDVPEIKTVAEKFEASWLNPNGGWNISPRASSADMRYKALQDVFSSYKSGYSVHLYACEVDSKQSELNQTMRVMSTIGYGLSVYNNTTSSSPLTAAKCATRLVTRGNKSYRIAVIIYDHTAG
jgi:hypothetical protein